MQTANPTDTTGRTRRAERFAAVGSLLLAAAAVVAGLAVAIRAAGASEPPPVAGHEAATAHQEATPSPDPTGTVIIDEYSGTKQAGPALTPSASPIASPAPGVIDTVRGDRADGPNAATPESRPIVIQRDRGVDWTVPVLLFATALTILGLGAIAAAVRSR